mgnify:FL=1
MILQLLFSFLVILLNAIFCCTVSGGGFGTILIQKVLILGFLCIIILYSICSSNGKSLVNILSSKKKYKSFSFQELKSTESSIDFLCKSILYIGISFLIFSCSYFFINIENKETIGKNLSTIILSLFYTIIIELILITLKSKIKKDQILFMAEEIETKNQIQDKKNKFSSIIKIFLSTILIFTLFALFIFVSNIENFNQSQYNLNSIFMWLDIPSFIELFVPSFFLLLISGNFKIFFHGIKTVVQNQKVSVSKKNLMQNAIKTFRIIIILVALSCTLIGFAAMNKFLDDKSLLGINIHVALIVSFYAVICNLILLPLEIKICKLAEEI